MEQNDISNNLKDVNQWTRILYMALFAIAYYASNILLWVIVIVQIVFSLVTGDPNSNLTRLGSSLAIYIFQLAKFLTYNTEEKPFPIQDWPEPQEDEDEFEPESEFETETYAENKVANDIPDSETDSSTIESLADDNSGDDANSSADDSKADADKEPGGKTNN